MGDGVKESAYGYEVIDEWSDSEDEPRPPGVNDEHFNFYDDRKKPSEGEIDAFLENVKELVTCGTSGLKADLEPSQSTQPDDLKSCKSAIVNVIQSVDTLFSSAQKIKAHIDSPNGTGDINLSINALNSHSLTDFGVKNNRSTVSYKPDGTLLKTIFPASTHSINEDSSSCISNQELSFTSDNLLIRSLKQNEDVRDGFSDNRKKDLINSTSTKQRKIVENDLKHRQKRSPEHSRSVERKHSDRLPSLTFSRERCNSRKEMFNERSSREKRRREEKRSRGKSRSRSRERRRDRRSRSSSRRTYTSLSPTPPPSRVLGANQEQACIPSYHPPVPAMMPSNATPYYPLPPASNPPYMPPSFNPSNTFCNPAPMGHSGAGGPSIAPYTVPRGNYPGYGGPVAQPPPMPISNMFPQAQGYPPYQGYQPGPGYQRYGPSYPLPPDQGAQPPNSWNKSTPQYPATYPSDAVSYAHLRGDSRGESYYNSSYKHHTPDHQSWMHSSSDCNDSSPSRKHSRSSSPESRKSHKRKSKRCSRSPDRPRSKSRRKHKESSSPDRHDGTKKPRVIIDPSRIPTPPPPPILSSTNNNTDRTRSKGTKSSESSLSDILDKETVSLSCLLEAVMETSGQGKSKVSDPKVKSEILSKCETKFRQLYKRRTTGRGAFIPDPVEARQINARGSPLITFHPHLTFNAGPEESVWRCPGIKVPLVKQVDPNQLAKPSPIGTLVSTDSHHYSSATKDSTLQNPLPVPYPQTSGFNTENWSGYRAPPTSTTYPQLSHSTNSWPETYNTKTTWQDRNEQYNLVAYPNLHPSELKNISYPAKPSYTSKMDSSQSSNYPPIEDIEPPPFKYRAVPQQDLLLLAGKKSKKKLRSSPPPATSRKSNTFSPHKSLSENELSSDLNNSHREEMSTPNYIVNYSNPNLVTLLTNECPAKSDSRKEYNNDDETCSKNYDNKKYTYDENKKWSEIKCSPTKEADPNSFEEAKDKLRRKFSSLRRTADTHQNEKDERFLGVDSSHDKETKTMVTHNQVITIEDSNYGKSPKTKCYDSSNESRGHSSKSSSKSPQTSHYKDFSLKAESKTETDTRASKDQEQSKYQWNSDNHEKRTNESDIYVETMEGRKKNDGSVAKTDSDSNENREKEANLGRELPRVEGKFTFSNLCEIGPEIRKIQEKSILYNGIIESLEKGDPAYRRLYTFKNSALCKIQKAMRKFKVVVPRDNCKDFILLIHKRFHSVSHEELFRSLTEFIYPQILHMNKSISKVFNECPDCKLQRPKVEPLLEKKSEKKSLNKAEKPLKPQLNKDKSKSPEEVADGNAIKTDRVSYSSSRHRNHSEKGKRNSESRERQASSSDGAPSGYEKAKKSKFINKITPKSEDSQGSKTSEIINNEEKSSNISTETKESLVRAEHAPLSESNDKESFNSNETISQNDKSTKDKEEPMNEAGNKKGQNKFGENTEKNVSGLDFKARVRNVQMKEYREVILSLESGDKSKDFESNYLLKAGMLCKKIQNKNGSEVKIVAPLSEVDEVIQIVHTMSNLHTPASKVFAFFNKHFTPVDDIDRKVNDFVNKCSQCINK